MADLSISSPPFRITGACHFRDFREMPKAATRTCLRRLSGALLSLGAISVLSRPAALAGRHRPRARHPRAVTQMLQLSSYRWELVFGGKGAALGGRLGMRLAQLPAEN